MKIGDLNERYELCVLYKFQFFCLVVVGGIGVIGLFIVKLGESVLQFFFCVFVWMGGKMYFVKQF